MLLLVVELKVLLEVRVVVVTVVLLKVVLVTVLLLVILNQENSKPPSSWNLLADILLEPSPWMMIMGCDWCWLWLPVSKPLRAMFSGTKHHLPKLLKVGGAVFHFLHLRLTEFNILLG